MTTHFNSTMDKIGYYVEQARDTSADLIAVLLKSSGLVTDGAMADYTSLSAIIAGTNDECDFTNYIRKTLTGASRTIDNTNDRVILDVDSPITWSSAGGTTNNAVGKLLYCYKPTSSSADSDVLPLMATDVTATTDGNDLVVTVHIDGFAVVRRPV